jgi:iron(III) transport system permease protein
LAVRWFCSSAFSAVTLLAVLPHLGVVLVAFSSDWYQTILPSGWTLSHFETALGHNLTLPSIQNSLKYAGLATLLDVVLGVAIAYVVVRTRLAGRLLQTPRAGRCVIHSARRARVHARGAQPARAS